MGLSKQQAIGIGILALSLLASTVSNNTTKPPFSNNQRLASRDNDPDANLIIISTEDDSKRAIKDINTFRKKSGLSSLNYSTKAYQLATARAKDMNQYNYFNFTNPQTKSCADTMKSGFGFTNEEFLAESNIRYVPVGANVGGSTKTVGEVSKEWLEDGANADPNFLFPQHVAGAVGCDGNKCVFLALNYSGYGKGCGVRKQ